MRKYLVWTNGSFSIEKDELWLVPYDENVLCKFDMRSNKLQKCFIWEKTDCLQGASYNVAKWQNKIVVIPARDNAIRVLSDDKLEKEYVIDVSKSLAEHYNITLSWRHKLFMFPVGEKSILELGEHGVRKVPCRTGIVESAVVYNECIFVITSEGEVWRYDKTLTQAERVMCNNKVHYCWMGVWNDKLVFSTKEGSLLLARNGVLHDLTEIGRAPEQTFFANGLASNNNILLFLNKDAERIFSFHFPSGCMYEREIERDKYWNDDWEYNAFGKPCVKDGKIYVMSPKHRALFVLDESGRILDKRHLLFDVTKEIRDEIAKRKLGGGQMIEENELLTLRDYLQYL